MKLLKQVKSIIQAQYADTRNRIVLTMMRLLHRLTIKRMKKALVKQNKPLDQTADKLRPILNKVSQTINDKPEIVQATLHHILNEVQNIASSNANKSEESASTIEPDGLEQKLRDLFAELNLAQLAGDKVAQQANVMLDKGFELTHQLFDSIELSQRQDLEGELNNDTLEQWDDFISQSNLLSLRADELQVHVNQLLSSYEIN